MILRVPKRSSIAQSVEHTAVNRGVVGSSPTGGAMDPEECTSSGFFFKENLQRKLLYDSIFIALYGIL